MKILNQIKDTFTTTEFEVESSMKVSELSKKFKNKFGLSLRIYKGKKIADDGRMTLNTLDQRTTQTNVVFDSTKLKIKASQKVLEVENMFLNFLGIVVQIADAENKKLVDNDLTLGDAKRQNL
jgi:hypothetical protein